MQLGELFSKTLRVDRPFGVFGLGVAPILAEGANGLPELTCWSRRWRLRPADHRGERGRFGTLSAG